MELVTPVLVQNSTLKFPVLCAFHLDLASHFDSDDPVNLNKNLEVEKFDFLDDSGQESIGRLQILTFTNQSGQQDVSVKLHVSKRLIGPNNSSSSPILMKDVFKGYEEFACFTIARVNLATSEKSKPPYEMTFYSTSAENCRQAFDLYSHQKYDNLYFQFCTFPFFRGYRNAFVVLRSNSDQPCRTPQPWVGSYGRDELLSSGKYSDLTIICGSDRFRVHKVVVCGRSPVIEKMVDTDMLEKENNEITLSLDTTEPEVVKDLLAYLYTDRCDGVAKHPHELFKLAHFLEVKDLETECELFLVQNIGMANIAESMNLVNNEQYELKSLALGIRNFVSANESDLLSNPQFLEYLCDSMEDSNLVFILELAYKHGQETLLATTMDFVRKHSKRLLAREDYKNMLRNDSELAIYVLGYISNFIV